MIIVDDGIATGSTVMAAATIARDLGANYVIIAIPVAPREAIPRLERIADEVVVVETRTPSMRSGREIANSARSVMAR